MSSLLWYLSPVMFRKSLQPKSVVLGNIEIINGWCAICSILPKMLGLHAFRTVVFCLRRHFSKTHPAIRRSVLVGVLWCTTPSVTPVNAATIVAASNSYTDVNTAVNTTAGRGDTVVVPVGTGTVTWPSTLTITKGVFLRGPGRDLLSIIRSGTAISVSPDSTAVNNEETIRVEGFTFDGNNAASYHIEIRGTGATAAKPFKNLAIGNNRFKNSTTVGSGNGAISTTGQVRGAIFGNIFDRCNVILKIMGNDSTAEWENGHFPFSYGNSDNLFFENNTIQWSSSFDSSNGFAGWSETGQGARLVCRYNHYDWTNAQTGTSDVHDIHGFQNWPGSGQTGTMIGEYYGNTYVNFPGYRWMAHRGSWLLMFNNIATGTGNPQIAMMQYGPLSGQAGGSGCCGDVPYAGGGTACGHYITEVNNTYVWNNTANGTMKNMSPWFTDGCGISGENVGYWNYNSSFNGSAGIGRGITTPTMTATNGVGYWRCSIVTPTVDPAIVQTGHFYKRVAGAWVDYYSPYTYPHPLTSGTPLPTPTATATATASPSSTTTPTPPPNPTATPSSTPIPLGLSFPATSGNISAPFAITGNDVSQDVETTDPTQGGRAAYTFAVPTAGDYLLSASVNCPDDSSNSFFVNIDSEPTTAMTWMIPLTSGFELRIASWAPNTSPKVWTLTAGTHQLIIRGREANAVLEHITLGTAPRPPEGLHVVP